MIAIIASYTGWGLDELMDRDTEELRAWLATCREIHRTG
uniref:Phage P2 GpE n=1 Tax=Candidatus Kentrum sp. TC TaxID=2126339 RepID=A0A451A1E1_9GAMM|nr:MAG: hypothetical protein BECKTC1821E_GA0114239_11058 [Candidatus Kentron sp. TC]VFK50696.1 MAG: hypothetical protein BECKTC1821D_GA0114238_111712 [Candidatus Kentron sp. TC]VFK59849.1 MAG: hypothetical protein BECKTC1821F_GA0114240_10388 [Candidatus Kentron sp. TC]